MNVCEHFLRIVYKCENQNIETFFVNMKFMGDLSLSIYFDLETTAGKKVYNFDEDATLYPVYYAFLIAFHPSLNIENISVVRSFNHTFEQLNDVSYLKYEILAIERLYCCFVDKKAKIFSEQNVFLRAEICYRFV